MKFYEIALEATTKIKEQFDVDTQRGMLDTAIPFIEKSLEVTTIWRLILSLL